MIHDLVKLSVADLLAAYRTRTLSPVEVTRAVLAQVERVASLNALFGVRAEPALEAAAQSEARWFRGAAGVLDGVPVTIKDSIHAVGMPYRHGTAANHERPESDFDAPPAARLKQAGAIIFAKTTMPDFGLLAAGVSSEFGVTRNPWGLAFNTGGSSAGAGASLAAGCGFLSVGTDIAGSVRLPAAHTGLVALKPTQGRIPHLAPSTTRSAGPMARDVADAALMLQVLAGADARDSLALPPDATRWSEMLAWDPRGVRVGVLLDMGFGAPPAAEIVATVRAAADALANLGADVSDMPAPFAHDAYATIDQTLRVRGLAELLSFTPDNRARVLPAVADWCRGAEGVSAVELTGWQAEIEADKPRFLAAQSGFDHVLAPVLPVVAFPAEDVGAEPSAPLSHARFTALFNQTGQPAATVCFGFDKRGLPIGVQIAGRRFDDLGVLRMVSALERARPIQMGWPLTPVP